MRKFIKKMITRFLSPYVEDIFNSKLSYYIESAEADKEFQDKLLDICQNIIEFHI